MSQRLSLTNLENARGNKEISKEELREMAHRLVEETIALGTDEEKNFLVKELYWEWPELTVDVGFGLATIPYERAIGAKEILHLCKKCGKEFVVDYAVSRSEFRRKGGNNKKLKLDTCPNCQGVSKKLQEQNNSALEYRIEKRIESRVESTRNHILASCDFTVAELKELPYKYYLKTKHWKDVRDRALEKAGYKCQLCGKKEELVGLHTHHNNYDNLGEEKDEDVIILCRGCHKKFHKV